ncbi:MAG: prolipoprotein diacylglyceryl transferase [Yaniella sp.]|uniref:prolipoprotein diacylglyceryl transferase n=1 Tax=Yaniella sp. TaxID=2773929 RepID=UPI002647ACAC|nr:prolipoprotein diacylglyceryl transferase [Yaniella sp.]MDN5730737.1 prolipoprotein diacylglyceryl transferase [Yaniella sp.]MDN5814748.1 prolipoprotein diacylglyceryl transferase [Yaniella sp.]MDN5817480.1 prolipoprotein diacylglyceryl transferase [Yaniella sp.]MDN5837889.1 prolipoprotein diacylglyceryl transferase [Yaniella sp.]MDN5888739.1 prolipoprotein diacylglyceryl transferase [Yaniella sp.]
MQFATLIASIPPPPLDGFEIGPVKIHLYALCIILGGTLAFWLGGKRWAARGGKSEQMYDVGLWAVVFGIIGARLYHVITVPDQYFGPNYDGTGDLSKIFAIWEGGIAIWGAIGGGALGVWFACRRYGLRMPAMADTIAPGILLAQAVGRWGNYFNQELFGEPSTLPWGLEVEPDHYNFPADVPADTLFHPTFLYESIWNLLGVAILLLIDRRFKLRNGMMLWSYIVWYTLGRIPIESIRLDKAQEWTVLGIEARTNTWTSVLMFLIAVTLLVYSIVTRPKTPAEQAEADKIYRGDYVSEEDAADSPVDSSTTLNNEVATSDNGDTSNPTT